MSDNDKTQELKPEAKPVPTIKPCPHCGSVKVHRHGSDDAYLVITHEKGCWEGVISVFKEDDHEHKAWENRI